jgi:hypothetical protein
MSAGWVARAQEVAAGGEPPEGWERIAGTAPPLLDGEVLRGAIAPLVAAIAWGGAVLREFVAGTPVDPLSVMLRLVALAMTVRAFLLGREVVRRVALLLRAPQCALVLAPERLLARLPDGDAAVERSEIVAITEQGAWQAGRPAGRRATRVYVVLASPLRTHLELPPIFDETPGVLAERLMRWRGAIVADPPPAPFLPAALASKVWDDAARGIRAPRTLVIPHGAGWLRRAPWATILLGFAILEGFLRASPEERGAIGAPAIAAVTFALVMVPGIWAWLTWRALAPHQGLAMVLTPAELLMRTRGGVLRVRWNRVQRLSIDARGRFSPIEGWAIDRALVIERQGDEPIRCDEAFLGVPAEVALGLCESYVHGAAQLARGAVASSATPAREHGIQPPQPVPQGPQGAPEREDTDAGDPRHG